MGIKEEKKVSVFKNSVFNRLGGAAAEPGYENGYDSGTVVCKFWLAGNCNRKSCRFSHHLSNTYCRVPDQKPLYGPTRSNTYHRVPPRSGKDSTLMRKACGNSKYNGTAKRDSHAIPPKSVAVVPVESTLMRKESGNSKYNGTAKGDSHAIPPKSVAVVPVESKSTKKVNKLCACWANDKCTHGDTCKFVHAWSVGEGFCSLAKLEGHNKDITGIALPSGSDKLYSASRDGSLRLWDCNTGKCAQVIDLGDEIGSLVSEGPWIFVGMPNVVKAWNVQTHAQFDLSGPVGQVYAMAVSSSDDMLFGGAQDGGILVWKGGMESSPFQELASLKGHNLAVLSLVVASKKLYSSSSDYTIRVWDMTTLQCTQTLCGHSDAVMSVLCWDQFLLSCSLDQTIKVWACSGENLEIVYTHEEEHMPGQYCIDPATTTLFVYMTCHREFAERGRLFSKQKVRTIQVGPGGLFFTGDGSGSLTVWRWSEKSQDTNGSAESARCI